MIDKSFIFYGVEKISPYLENIKRSVCAMTKEQQESKPSVMA